MNVFRSIAGSLRGSRDSQESSNKDGRKRGAPSSKLTGETSVDPQSPRRLRSGRELKAVDPKAPREKVSQKDVPSPVTSSFENSSVDRLPSVISPHAAQTQLSNEASPQVTTGQHITFPIVNEATHRRIGIGFTLEEFEKQLKKKPNRTTLDRKGEGLIPPAPYILGPNGKFFAAIPLEVVNSVVASSDILSEGRLTKSSLDTGILSETPKPTTAEIEEVIGTNINSSVVTPKLKLTSLIVHTLRKTHQKYREELQEAATGNQELLDMLDDNCENARIATQALATLQRTILEDESQLMEINKIFDTNFDLDGFKILLLQESPTYSLEISPSDMTDEVRRVMDQTSSDAAVSPTCASDRVSDSGEISEANHDTTKETTGEDMVINHLVEESDSMAELHQWSPTAQKKIWTTTQQNTNSSDLDLAVAASRRGIDLLGQLNTCITSTAVPPQTSHVTKQNQTPPEQPSSTRDPFFSVALDAMLQRENLQSASSDLIRDTQSETEGETQPSMLIPKPLLPRPQETRNLPQVTRKHSAARMDLMTRFGNQQPMASSSPKPSVSETARNTVSRSPRNRTSNVSTTNSDDPSRASRDITNWDESTVSSINVDKTLRGMGLIEEKKLKSAKSSKETLDKEEIIKGYLHEVAREAGYFFEGEQPVGANPAFVISREDVSTELIQMGMLPLVSAAIGQKKKQRSGRSVKSIKRRTQDLMDQYIESISEVADTDNSSTVSSVFTMHSATFKNTERRENVDLAAQPALSRPKLEPTNAQQIPKSGTSETMKTLVSTGTTDLTEFPNQSYNEHSTVEPSERTGILQAPPTGVKPTLAPSGLTPTQNFDDEQITENDDETNWGEEKEVEDSDAPTAAEQTLPGTIMEGRSNMYNQPHHEGTSPPGFEDLMANNSSSDHVATITCAELEREEDIPLGSVKESAGMELIDEQNLDAVSLFTMSIMDNFAEMNWELKKSHVELEPETVEAMDWSILDQEIKEAVCGMAQLSVNSGDRGESQAAPLPMKSNSSLDPPRVVPISVREKDPPPKYTSSIVDQLLNPCNMQFPPQDAQVRMALGAASTSAGVTSNLTTSCGIGDPRGSCSPRTPLRAGVGTLGTSTNPNWSELLVETHREIAELFAEQRDLTTQLTSSNQNEARRAMLRMKQIEANLKSLQTHTLPTYERMTKITIPSVSTTPRHEHDKARMLPGVKYDPNFDLETWLNPGELGWDYQLEILNTGIPVPLVTKHSTPFSHAVLPAYNGTQEFPPEFCASVYRMYASEYGLKGVSYAHQITKAMAPHIRQRINLLPPDQRNNPAEIVRYLFATYRRENSEQHYESQFRNLRMDDRSTYIVHFERMLSLARAAFPTEGGITTRRAKQRLLEQFMSSIKQSGHASSLLAYQNLNLQLVSQISRLVEIVDENAFLQDVRNIISTVESTLVGLTLKNDTFKVNGPHQNNRGQRYKGGMQSQAVNAVETAQEEYYPEPEEDSEQNTTDWDAPNSDPWRQFPGEADIYQQQHWMRCPQATFTDVYALNPVSGQLGRPKSQACFVCGSLEHFARECPQKPIGYRPPVGRGRGSMFPNQNQQQRAPGVQGEVQFNAPRMQNQQRAQAAQQPQAQHTPWLTKDQLVQDNDLMKNLTEQVLQRLRPKQSEQKQVTIATNPDQGNSDREPRN